MCKRRFGVELWVFWQKSSTLKVAIYKCGDCFNLSMWTLLETAPLERSVWWGWEKRREKVKCKHSVYICLENPHTAFLPWLLHSDSHVERSVLQPVLCWASCSHPAQSSSVPYCFLMREQLDVSRMRPSWSIWWITGCLCCSPCQESGRQCWWARVEKDTTAVLCSCWWISSPVGWEHCGQMESEWGIKGTVFAAVVFWMDKAEQDFFGARRESAALIKVWVLRLPLRNADLGPQNPFHIHAAASSAVNKSLYNMYAVLPVVAGHWILPQGALQVREGGRTAKPGVASQSPTVWYTWDLC